MQVILLEKVPNLGNLGEVVKVKDGFARNFLIPTRAARRATPAAIKEFEDKRAELEKAAADKLASAQALGEKMSGRTVHITQKAGVDGRLFGSVTNADVADALNRIDFKVQKSQVRMPNGPLKSVGEHTVTVAPHGDVVVEVKVVSPAADRAAPSPLRSPSSKRKGRAPSEPLFLRAAQGAHGLSTGFSTAAWVRAFMIS
jgi:large subunit ribosomal protein L9